MPIALTIIITIYSYNQTSSPISYTPPVFFTPFSRELEEVGGLPVGLVAKIPNMHEVTFLNTFGLK